jgi:hypothetical protein
MKTFIDPNLLLRLRVGPLAPYLDAYLKHIQQLGFLPTSAPMQMYAIARFSRWLGDQSFDLCRLDEAIVRRFLERDPSIVHSAESATIHRLLAMLRRIGVALPKTPKPVHYQQRFIEAYRCYLLQERGLAIATVAYFVICSGISVRSFRQWRLEFSRASCPGRNGFCPTTLTPVEPGAGEVARDRFTLSPALHATPGRDFHRCGKMRARSSHVVSFDSAKVSASWCSATPSRSL